MLRLIASQFRKPSGLLGSIASALMKKGNRIAYDKIIPELALQGNERILEIGYGHGLGIDRISSLCDGFITGIDFSELMFREARRRNKRHIKKKKVELRCGDFLALALEEKKYDRIFCVNVVYFWKSLDKPFAKIYFGLRTGGLFCMFMAHRDDLEKMKFTRCDIFNKYSIDEVAIALKTAGFGEVTWRFDKGYVISCKKV